MKNIFRKSLFIAASCLLASGMMAETITVDLVLQKNATPNPPKGVIIGDSYNTGNFDGNGYKIGSDGNSIGWNIASTGKVIKSASFKGYINTTNTSKNWGFKFSTDGGTTWGSELTQANDGIKSAHDINVSVAIPNGANAIKIIRKAGTTSYVMGITLELGYLNPVTSISVAPTSLNVVQGDISQLTATVLPANATHPDVIWSSSDLSVASVDPTGKVTALGVGSATITATTEDGGFTATCPITVGKNPNPVAVTGVTLNKTSTSIWPGNSEILIATIFPANATVKGVTWSSNNTTVATVDQTGKVNGLANGTATITVTTTDGQFTATCAVEVSDVLPMPATNLTLHQSGVYEEKTLAGGYNTKMTEWNSRAYEVYYCFKGKNSSGSGIPSAATTPGGSYITDDDGDALDGWFESNPGSVEEQGAGAIEEFAAGTGDWKMNGQYLELHVKGYDQFSILAQDGDLANTNKQFHVYLNTAEKPQTPSTTPSKRSFELNPGKEYLIRVEAGSGAQIKFYGFSLREAQAPRSKWITGNDSTQEVLQTTAIRPVTYATKYNNIAGAETKLLWDGPEANGFTLSKTEGAITDTLRLTGVANCPVGTYKYRVAAFYNGLELNSVSGTFKVTSTIKITSKPDVTVYQNEDIDDPVTFRYYALSESDVQLTWTGTEPDGIIGSGSNGVYTIGGRPTTIGTYPYSITVTGGDTTFQGTITVETLDLGNNPILYLCKDVDKSKNDPVFKHLTSSAGGNKNLIRRKARREGLRTLDQYATYKWILISEDVDADNEEVLAIVRGGVDLPVFNMKGFTYSGDRLGWGYPDNGTVDTVSGNNCNIYIHRNDHPIFSRFNAKQGDKLTIFEKMDGNGIMPIAISGEAMQNTLCLATGYTRDIDFYDQDGELQTAIHEIPARMRGGKKYICMPLAFREGNKLSSQGKALIDAIVSYLLDNGSAAPAAPQLQINSFSIMGVAGKVNQTDNTIVMEFDVNQFPDLDLHEVVPQITLADPNYTFVTPASGDTVDFQYSTFLPVKFIVSDYISKREYNVIVRTYDPQGIENVYEAGMWVNIFDIYGRKIATTNEDIYSMELPRGVYLVVMENGETIKLMR